MRDEFLSLLFDYAKENSNVIVLTGDLGYGALDRFFHDLPDQIINLGIAEQSMISIASGLAQEGKKVFVYSITNFVSLRVVEQIRNDLCYHNLDVTILAIGTGLAYGQLGFTHHATEDIAVIRSLPNIMIFTPSDPIETKFTFDEVIENIGPKYVKLDKGGKFDKTIELSINDQPRYLGGEGDTVILSYGRLIPMLIKLIESESINENSYRLYSITKMKPMVLSNDFINIISDAKKIVTIEEHNLSGGFGSIILEYLEKIKIDYNVSKIHRIGLDDIFSKTVIDSEYMLSALLLLLKTEQKKL